MLCVFWETYTAGAATSLASIPQSQVHAVIALNVLTKFSIVGLLAAGTAVVVTACEARANDGVGMMVCALPHEPESSPAPKAGHADLTGHTRLGKASFYAQSFTHRTMANGHRMNPRSDNAASRTLPLGTMAKVINLRTGQSAVVSIEDRGPYVQGRIVDLSPATARQIGITRHVGVAEVKIAPIAVPLPDGTLMTGSGAWRKPICRIKRAQS